MGCGGGASVACSLFSFLVLFILLFVLFVFFGFSVCVGAGIERLALWIVVVVVIWLLRLMNCLFVVANVNLLKSLCKVCSFAQICYFNDKTKHQLLTLELGIVVNKQPYFNKHYLYSFYHFIF